MFEFFQNLRFKLNPPKYIGYDYIKVTLVKTWNGATAGTKVIVTNKTAEELIKKGIVKENENLDLSWL